MNSRAKPVGGGYDEGREGASGICRSRGDGVPQAMRLVCAVSCAVLVGSRLNLEEQS